MLRSYFSRSLTPGKTMPIAGGVLAKIKGTICLRCCMSRSVQTFPPPMVVPDRWSDAFIVYIGGRFVDELSLCLNFCRKIEILSANRATVIRAQEHFLFQSWGGGRAAQPRL